MAENEAALVVVNESPVVALGSLEVEPGQIVAQASAMATELAQVIKSRKLFTVIQGKEYVKVEGWTTLGAMLGVVPREVSVVEEEDGSVVATVEIVRGDGGVIGRASAVCGMDERRWSNAERYARRSMAVTRATGKAYRLGFSWIMSLAGFQPTPAEEMPVMDAPAQRAPRRRVEKDVTPAVPDGCDERDRAAIWAACQARAKVLEIPGVDILKAIHADLGVTESRQIPKATVAGVVSRIESWEPQGELAPPAESPF